MLKRVGQFLDDTLLIVLLVATVGHIAAFMQTYEEPSFRWAAWLQAVGIDLATLRASYLYKIYGTGQARSIALVAVVFFSVCSAILNFAYYVRAGADILIAVPMAAFFPVAITILSYLRGAQDMSAERRDRRLAGRTGGQIGTSESHTVQSLDDIGRTLPEGRTEQRAAVGQLRAQGLTLREISDQTGVPKSTISVWLRKAEQAEGNDGATGG